MGVRNSGRRSNLSESRLRHQFFIGWSTLPASCASHFFAHLWLKTGLRLTRMNTDKGMADQDYERDPIGLTSSGRLLRVLLVRLCWSVFICG
jgi:hypothetical protein